MYLMLPIVDMASVLFKSILRRLHPPEHSVEIRVSALISGFSGTKCMRPAKGLAAGNTVELQVGLGPVLICRWYKYTATLYRNAH